MAFLVTYSMAMVLRPCDSFDTMRGSCLDSHTILFVILGKEEKCGKV
tara:strand:+ start:1717 stop:1857 length:141 start_codon:yes stop_codon:yes gene_type:complete